MFILASWGAASPTPLSSPPLSQPMSPSPRSCCVVVVIVLVVIVVVLVVVIVADDHGHRHGRTITIIRTNGGVIWFVAQCASARGLWLGDERSENEQARVSDSCVVCSHICH